MPPHPQALHHRLSLRFFRISLIDAQASVISNFKLRTSGAVSVPPGTIGLMSALNQYNDGYRIYPTWSGDYPPSDPFSFTNAPTTYDAGAWGHSPTGNSAGLILEEQFATVYPGGSVVICGTKTLTFTSASAIDTFLQQGGSALVPTTSYVNPTGALGVFSGQVPALRLNIDFSAAGVFRQGLGAMVVQENELAGYTVAQVLALCNTALGAPPPPFRPASPSKSSKTSPKRSTTASATAARTRLRAIAVGSQPEVAGSEADRCELIADR